MQDGAKHDPVIGAGLGIVDAFDAEGNFHGTFAPGGTLNAPWGMVMAPATFGTFSGDVLIGNFGDGTISAYDTAGQFKGQVTDSAGHVIVNPGLWDMVFGAGGTGDPNTLYITAGGANQTSGLFATLVPATAVGGPDFSLSLSAPSVTVPAGSSATLMIGSAAVGGFNGQITLSCATGCWIHVQLRPHHDFARFQRSEFNTNHHCGGCTPGRRLRWTSWNAAALRVGTVRNSLHRWPQQSCVGKGEEPDVDRPSRSRSCEHRSNGRVR